MYVFHDIKIYLYLMAFEGYAYLQSYNDRFSATNYEGNMNVKIKHF